MANNYFKSVQYPSISGKCKLNCFEETLLVRMAVIKKCCWRSEEIEAFNPSTLEAEQADVWEIKASMVYIMSWRTGQPGSHRRTLSQETKQQTNKRQKQQETKNSHSLLVGVQINTPAMEISLEGYFFFKVKNRSSIWPNHSTPYFTQRTPIFHRGLYLHVCCCSVHCCRWMEPAHMSVNTWMDDEELAHI